MFCSFGNYRKFLGRDCGLAAHNGLKVKTVRCRHTGLKGRLSPRPLRIPGSLLRAVAGWTDVFQGLQFSTAKCRRLGGAFAAGLLGLWPRPSGRCYATLSRFARLEPEVSNLSLSAIFDCGFEAFIPCRFNGVPFCSSP